MPTATSQTWRNSLAIHLPKEVTDKMGIEQASKIELKLVKYEEIIRLKPKMKR